MSFSGCNDNPTPQQFMGAYRKLLLHNEVVSGRGANCLNDITKVLYVPSKSKDSSICTNKAELECLSNYDFENQVDYADDHLMENNEDALKQNSLAYVASILEEMVVRKTNNKGQKCCAACIQVFLENEIIDDSFIEYKSETCNILSPCKSTIKLMNTVDNLLNAYKSQKVSLNSTVTHIMLKIDKDRFYEYSSFDQHDHKHELIELIIKTYMDLKSTEACKHITEMWQKKRIRHSKLKEIHRAGQ